MIPLSQALPVVVAAAFGLTACGRTPTSAPKPALTGEEKAYLQQIVVTEAHLSAEQNFLGDTVAYLDAQLTNSGSKLVRRLEIQLEFHDALNQVVLRESSHPVSLRSPPLKPGETRPFRVTFEHLPAEWNGLPPVIKATRVDF